MNVIIPPKRRDKKTSFRKLVNYVSTREEKKPGEAVTHEAISTGTEYVSTPGFGQLVDYVGRKRAAPATEIVSISPEGIQRVLSGEVLCETNCWSLDTAASEMDMTASQNRHCKDAVYHFILSWQGDEDPSPDAVFRSVRYSLKQLGMEEHQYVAAIHRDTDNIHCHVSANRVHPTTFRAQNMWNDADELQKCCRVLEREFDFKVDNGSWHMDEYGDLHRTRRDMPSAPRGAAKREIFSDKESLHGYAVRETRQLLSDVIAQDNMSWDRLHNILYTRGLGLREQSGGLAVYDLMNPEGVSVKASDVHPDISLVSMVSQHGKYQPAPPVYNPDRPEDGMLDMQNCYMPQLHVRDQEARRERREARAIARDILRARYDAYRTGWEKPDLRSGERFRQIASHCVVAKAHVRDTVRDPLMRKLMYRVAEFEKMKAMAELRLQLREERQTLKDTGESRPLSWKSWVEREAVNGDVAALSQMRGWAYREKRIAKERGTQNKSPDAVVYFGPGDDAPLLRNPTHDVMLSKHGCVEYQRNGKTEVVDYGDRVEVYPQSEADQETWWLAAAVTARRSGENAVINGEQKSVTRLLDSGAVLNANNAVHRFSVGNKAQQDRIDVTESWFREKYRNNAAEMESVPRYDSNEPENTPARVIRDLPRP
ncbi:TraI/MobA(P) family conjugative relaxase [Pantoea phytobeneficialis]|uniref:Mobilization protein n=1 Tax=Pantoea phytobeneficialis TaxID=2052056 RepID=A0AAP9KRV3_9GAMM|nr:TraI/MobA(P) family conjugative relaxase [Pantoea phytobeneficialis]MDO6407447.1 TraI/MobA(P) family conjugative relaxase [Pantoea phytobeneficialis]QGR09506.1 mobilization protein [Pantoea phytobeneficialis]